MKIKYDVEISGSITAHRKANTHLGLKRIANRALGRVSVVKAGVEIFFGSGRELAEAIEAAEKYGKEF